LLFGRWAWVFIVELGGALLFGRWAWVFVMELVVGAGKNARIHGTTGAGTLANARAALALVVALAHLCVDPIILPKHMQHAGPATAGVARVLTSCGRKVTFVEEFDTADMHFCMVTLVVASNVEKLALYVGSLVFLAQSHFLVLASTLSSTRSFEHEAVAVNKIALQAPPSRIHFCSSEQKLGVTVTKTEDFHLPL